MGPWSRGGVRIGEKEKWSWTLKLEIKEAHLRTIYSADWAEGGIPTEEGGLGRIVTGGGDGRINVFQMVRLINFPDFLRASKLIRCFLDPFSADQTN